MTKTTFVKPNETDRRWLLIDGSDKVFGRLAARVAMLLRGKHKPIYSPHQDNGDEVIVINASKLRLTGGKAAKTMRYRHSGFMGGLKAEPFGALFTKDPARAFRAAVKGMLPHNDLGRLMVRKLKVYAGAEHPHQAQLPEPYEVKL